MKKIFTIIAFLFFSFQIHAQRSNCEVSPEKNTFKQADGTIISVLAYGNEQEHYTETEDGYTILLNKDGIFEYAHLDANGNLSPSGIKAHNGSKFLGKNSFSKHLRYSKTQREILANAFNQMNISTKKLGKKAGPMGFPTKGVHKVCVLLIQYPDLLATTPISVFENLFNQVNYNGTGSVRDYYLKTSFNQLTLNHSIYGWFMADMNYKSYGRNNPNGNSNTQDLVRDVVEAADSAGVDFSQFDNDKDGEVDGLLILHSGIGAEEQSAPSANDYIWSHRSNFWGNANISGSTRIGSYCMFPEKRYNNASYSTVGIGVISHEFGHILDLPDLYSTQSNGEGAGNFTNMAGGPWLNNERTPCLFDAWSKMKLEWHTPTLISQNGVYTISKSANDSNFSYRINTPNPDQYYLLENKQQKGNDRYLPGRGLAIWHVNVRSAGLLSESGNDVNNDTSEYGMGLKQADGFRQLEREINRGDAGDLYPGTSNNRNFNSTSNPSSYLHPDGSGNRLPSNVSIGNITINADSSITFTLGSKPFALFDGGSTKGCLPYQVSFKNNSQFANSYSWNFGDGSNTVNESNPVHTFTKTGSFNVKLIAYDVNNVPVDSSIITYTVTENAKAEGLVTRITADSFYFENKSSNYDFITWRFGNSSTSLTRPFGFKFKTLGKTNVTLTAVKQNCADTFKTEIDVWSVGLNENELLKNVSVYPNPFGNELSVDFESIEKNQAEITVYSIIGKQIFSKTFETKTGLNNIKLNAEIEKSGIYVVKIKIDKHILTYKVNKL